MASAAKKTKTKEGEGVIVGYDYAFKGDPDNSLGEGVMLGSGALKEVKQDAYDSLVGEYLPDSEIIIYKVTFEPVIKLVKNEIREVKI